MGTYGHIIKFERIRQNIKQLQLAKDICTPAYLSKIESNSIVPSEEVRKKLFERLEINPTISTISEEEYFQYVRVIYSEAIMQKDRVNIEIQLNKILQDYFVFYDSDKYLTYLLLVLRLKMLTNNKKYDTNTFIMLVSRFSGDFNTYQLFLFYSCLAYFHYYNKELDLSLEAIEKALIYHDLITVPEHETADFYYGLGTIYLQNQKLMASLEYNDKALSYFNKEFLFFRAIESNIIKAVAYKRSGNIDQAYENLLLAEKISLHHNSLENLSMIYLNIASIHNLKKNFQLSLEFYQKSIQVGHDFKSKLISIYSIVLENSTIKDFEEVLKWSNYGITLYEENPLEEMKGMFYHFKCHISKNSGFENFESTVSETIHHFVTTQDYRNANKYALLLANYFHNERKYKKATTYFSLANKYLAKKENRKYIEDI
ncbi:MAG: helix-turn-helix domain-containing protein [Paenisporosarcina sp.]